MRMTVRNQHFAVNDPNYTFTFVESSFRTPPVTSYFIAIFLMEPVTIEDQHLAPFCCAEYVRGGVKRCFIRVI